MLASTGRCSKYSHYLYYCGELSIFSFFIADTSMLAAQDLSMAEHEEGQENQRFNVGPQLRLTNSA
jgi:hypothetical protein